MTEKKVVPKRKKSYHKAVGPRLQKVLNVVFGLFALLCVNAVYLLAVTVAGVEYQNWFYLINFGLHLILGIAIIVPVIIFMWVHIRNTLHRKNKRAIRVGWGLFWCSVILLVSGIVLTRMDIFGFRFEINDPTTRSISYWLHVLTPLFCAWLYILHRLVGKKLNWRMGAKWAAVAIVFAGIMVFVQMQDPRKWNQEGPDSGVQYFFPSLARTADGNFIPAKVLANDQYCLDCHEDNHEQWNDSAHHFSSFNNPVYLASIKATRKVLMERDGNVQGARFCAGCHDPVPFFSGAFDDPKFDDPDYDLASDPSAQAGVTCTSCHAITHVNSTRGNSDYTIEEPVHYPFTFTDNKVLKWANHQLIKAKPAFHKATFLKPLHKTPEYCGGCHKVHIPQELNDYKWLRGQNHLDTFQLSGVSGHGIASFYYPAKAEENCNDCHLPLVEVGDGVNFSARDRDDSGTLKTMDHRFPSANTALTVLKADEFMDIAATMAAHENINDGVVRLDFFALKEDGNIDGKLIAPLRPEIPKLEAGKSYLLETLIRTVKMGHHLTQGTTDSNQLWMDVEVTLNGEVIGRSGGMNEAGEVDKWSHFIHNFILDREGNRINERNVQDIFVNLYNNQIPPGAADVIHYRLNVPEGATGELKVNAKLNYRKFDTELMRFVLDDPDYVNNLPILLMAEDEITFQLDAPQTVEAPDFPLWQRWNDYGIALLRKGRLGELREARVAFEKVEEMGRADGPLNLARTYIKEGLVQTEAPAALERAATMETPANAWSLLWFGAQVSAANGDYAKAEANLRDILKGGFAQAKGRGFDFSEDWRVHNALANAIYQQALASKGSKRETRLKEAAASFETTLTMDSEDLAAHWGLKQIYRLLGDKEREAKHAKLHAKYKPDDNAIGQAVAKARAKYPAANHAAEDIVIYDLHRDGATGLPASEEK